MHDSPWRSLSASRINHRGDTAGQRGGREIDTLVQQSKMKTPLFPFFFFFFFTAPSHVLWFPSRAQSNTRPRSTEPNNKVSRALVTAKRHKLIWRGFGTFWWRAKYRRPSLRLRGFGRRNRSVTSSLARSMAFWVGKKKKPQAKPGRRAALRPRGNNKGTRVAFGEPHLNKRNEGEEVKGRRAASHVTSECPAPPRK